MFGAINADTISDSTPPTWAGFFFCLASAEGAGLLFCPYTIHPHTSIYSAFCVVHAVIPPTPQNSTQGFAKAFPVICPTPAHAIQQEHKPPIRRLCSAGGHTVKRCTSTNTQIPAPRRTLYSSKQLPIIIRYIRVQRCACYGSTPDGATYSRPCQPGAEPLAALAAALFGLSPDS